MLKLVYKNTWLSWLILSAATVILYSATLSYGFLNNYDDDNYLLDSRISHLNGHNVKEYFTGYYLGMYQPLPVLSFAAILKIFPGSAGAQHAVNLLLHCLNALLVLILIKKITGNADIANLSALLFAIHPMHVESVAWIAARSNLMYSFFFLLALILYHQWQDDRRWRTWTFMLLSFILALFCKVTAATFPLLLILFDWYKAGKIEKKNALLYIPLFLLSLCFIFTGVTSSAAFGHITDMGQQYSFFQRIWIILHALWLYLSKAIFPVSQSVIYLFPWKSGNSLPSACIISGIITLVILGSLLIFGWKHRKKESGRAILFGLLFFLITISIVLPLKWSRTVLVAERYTYIPYIGFFAGMLLLAFHGMQNLGKWFTFAVAVVISAMVVWFSLLTWERNKVWKDPVALFSDVIEKNRSGAETSMGYYNRGNEYLRQKQRDKALADFSEAVRVYPGYTEAWYNRGLVLYNLTRYPEAIHDFSEAIRLRSDYLSAYLNRGTVYRAAGDYELALADFTRAISISPYGPAYFSRGVLLHFNFGETGLACADWAEALRLGYEPSRELLDRFCR
jgi:protein O-mannosyl-transferase